MPDTQEPIATSSKKSVQFKEDPTIHIVENWKEFNFTPKETKIIMKQEKNQKVIIRTDCEKFFIESYNKVAIAFKELTTSCSFI